MQTGKLVATVVGALVLVGTGCGEDDGGSVREIESGESGSGSGSASASGSASGSASASGPASGSASGTGECHVEDGATGEATAEVHGELTEFEITIDEATVPAGLVSFEFENAGGLAHEVAVVRADDPSTLPTTDDGAVDDEALGDDLVGEIEPFAAGATCSGTFDLEPGTYVLLCNIVEEGGDHEAHVAEGMTTTLTVNG
jgi:plastocyanin